MLMWTIAVAALRPPVLLLERERPALSFPSIRIMRWACGNSQYALHRERDTRTMKCEDDNGCCKLPGNLPDKMGERKERKLIINRRRRRDGTHCVTRLFLGRTRVFVAG